ncbi:hypothetical protein BT69DRAFT_1305018 [Atractiella rhizophila]|nr:hypothetical protein BT69DRAFT_1305018 [Atractiella rhizophila]
MSGGNREILYFFGSSGHGKVSMKDLMDCYGLEAFKISFDGNDLRHNVFLKAVKRWVMGENENVSLVLSYNPISDEFSTSCINISSTLQCALWMDSSLFASSRGEEPFCSSMMSPKKPTPILPKSREAILNMDETYVLNISVIAKYFRVPRTSLAGRIKGAKAKSEEMKRRQKLSPDEEASIVTICDRSLNLFFPVTKSHIISIAKKIFKKKYPHAAESSTPGNSWYYAFMARHSELRNRTAYRIGRELVAISADEIERWYEELARAFAKREHVVVRRRREVGDIEYVQDGNREWITVIECNFISSWIEDPLPGATYSCTLSGWTDEGEGITWLKIWEEETQPWRLLIMDGHGSHQTIEFLEYALAHNILPFCTIPHSTHLCQPLDVGVFSPLSHNYNYSQVLNQTDRERKEISKGTFSRLFQEAHELSYRPEVLRKAFEATWVWPVNMSANTGFVKFKEKLQDPFQKLTPRTTNRCADYLLNENRPSAADLKTMESLKERWMNSAVESKRKKSKEVIRKGTVAITAEKLAVLKAKVVAEEQEKVRKKAEKVEKLEEKVRKRMGKIEASAAKISQEGEGGGREDGEEEKEELPAVEQEFRTYKMESKYCGNGSWKLRRRSINPSKSRTQSPTAINQMRHQIPIYLHICCKIK